MKEIFELWIQQFVRFHFSPTPGHTARFWPVLKFSTARQRECSWMVRTYPAFFPANFFYAYCW